MTELPNSDEIAAAIIQYASDGNTCILKDLHNHLVDYFCLTDAQVEGKTERSKGTPLFESRINTASSRLIKAGLLCRKTPGVYVITERGMDVSSLRLMKIDIEFLRQYPEFTSAMEHIGNGQKQRDRMKTESPVTDGHLSMYREIAIEKATELLVEVAMISPGLLTDLLTPMIRSLDEQNTGFALELIKRCNKGLIDNHTSYQPDYSEDDSIARPVA